MAPEAVAEAYHAFEQGSKVAPLTAASISNQSIQESMRVLLMVRAYQVSGCAFIASTSNGTDILLWLCSLQPTDHCAWSLRIGRAWIAFCFLHTKPLPADRHLAWQLAVLRAHRAAISLAQWHLGSLGALPC